MIRHQDERALIPQILGADNLEAMPGAQQSANDQRDERAQTIDQHVRLAREIPQAFDHGLVEVGRRRVVPPFHRKG